MFMRKFNLKEYETNKFKVVTADGFDVRIICTDRMTSSFITKNKRVVVALVKEPSGEELPHIYDENGESQLLDKRYYLFFKITKKEGYVNVFHYTIEQKDENNNVLASTEYEYIQGGIYEYEALAINDGVKEPNYKKTIKIEYEE